MPQYGETREIRTYAHLYYAAGDALEKAKSTKEGRNYSIIVCLVLSAFSLEGYLNHIGKKVIDYWVEIERISTIAKLKVLYSHLSLEYEPSKRPVQTVIQLFKFRNFMAHAKTEYISGSITSDVMEINPKEHLIEADWERFLNEGEANRGLEDVKDIMRSLHAAIGCKGDPLEILEISYGGED